MGMDCIPRKKDVEPMHANWSGWRFLSLLLSILEADLTRMAGSNDGEYVDTRTAKKWGKILNKALDDKIVMIERSPSSYTMGGYEESPHVVTTEEIERMKNIDPIQLKVELVLDDTSIVPLDGSTEKWLREWANFFIESGGFYQW